MQPLQVDRGALLGDDEEDRALLVLQEQVLAVQPDDRAAQALRLLDSEEGRVLDGGRLDAEIGELAVEIVLRGRHLALDGLSSRAADEACRRRGRKRFGRRSAAHSVAHFLRELGLGPVFSGLKFVRDGAEKPSCNQIRLRP
jgi:hypothetical protein